MKKRKITKSAVTNIFRFISCHKPEPVSVEGYNEFIACHYFEFSPLVIYFEAQPQKFEFPIEGTNRPLIYSPDFLVRLHDQQQVYFELKPYEITLTEEFSRRWEFLQKTFVDMGLRLELVIDRQLTRGEMAENLKLVHRYMNRAPNTAEQENILKLISNAPLSVTDISEQLQLKESVTISYLLNLVAKKQLSFPLYAPLNFNTVFQRPQPVNECNMDKVFEQIFPVPDHITHDEFKEAFRKEVKQRLDDADSYEHLDALPEREREQAIFRWKVLSKVGELCNGVLSNQRLAAIYKELESDLAEKTPSISSIKRWAKIYDESGRSIKALSPNISERGNKTHRLSSEIEELIQQALDRIKDTKSGAVSSAYSYLQHLVFQFNQRSGLAIKAPSLQTFWARFKKISPYEMAIKCKGKFKASKEFKNIAEMIKTNRLLERVEIDHTQLDFIVVEKDSFIPLGRPWITTLCDVHSRSVLGFYIGFTPPSFVAVARALKHALLPKDYVLSRYPDIKNPWLCFGKPELIVSDNGKEFDDRDFKLALSKLFMNSGKNPTATPYLKPIVERYFGKKNSELLRAHPGHTLATLKRSKDYDPVKNAVVDMDGLLHIVHIWICDIHQAGPNSRRDRIPNFTWVKALDKFAPVQHNYDAEDLNLIFCRTSTGQLRRDGVTFKHLRYSSDASAELRGRVGDHQITYKIDPENLGYMYISNQLTQSFLKVPAVKFEYASSVTLHQHKINCIVARKNVGDNYCEEDILEANSRIHLLIEEAFVAKGQSKRRTGSTSKAARYKEDSKRAKSLAAEQHNENLVPLINAQNEEKSDQRVIKPIDTTGWELL